MNRNAFASLLSETATAECPRPEVFLADEWADLSAAERTRIERHLETCALCAAEQEAARLFDQPITAHEESEVLAVVAQLQTLAPRAIEASKASPAPTNVVRFPTERARRPRFEWALAAAAVLALAVGSFLHWKSTETPDLGLPPSESDIVRGSEVVLEMPLGDLDSFPERLAWRVVEGAVRYRVSLLAVDDQVLWTAETEGREITLPADVRARLTPAVSYRIKVEALDGSGAVLAVSETGRFRVRPTPEN